MIPKYTIVYFLINLFMPHLKERVRLNSVNSKMIKHNELENVRKEAVNII